MEKEWRGKIFFSHGWSNSSGVTILIPNNLLPDFKINNLAADHNGRLLILDCRISDNPFIRICIYFLRLNFFHWLKTNHSGITTIQETHTISNDEQILEKEWGGKIFFSHGLSNSSEVTILIPNNLLPDFKINNLATDHDGRLLILDCSISDNPFIIICIYFPTKDKVQQQLDYLKNF